MDNTIIQQGSFISTGTSMTIPVRSGIDWMEIINYTQSIAQPGGGNATAVRHFWSSGMPTGLAVANVKNGASDALTSVASVANSFNLVDSSASMLGTPIAVTAGTNVAAPVYSTANTNGLVVGNIVRVYGTAFTDWNGMDFSVGAVAANANFTPAYAASGAPGVPAGAGAGFWQFVAPDLATYKLFYPSRRTIVNITQAAQAVITTSVAHGYTIGQNIRIDVPAVCGMIQMNGLIGTITAVTAGTFTVNINSTNFTAFTFPTAAQTPCTFAQAVPMGTTAGGVLDDATYNQGYIGMILGGGLAAIGAAANGPAGILGDVVYWRAGKSFNL